MCKIAFQQKHLLIPIYKNQVYFICSFVFGGKHNCVVRTRRCEPFAVELRLSFFFVPLQSIALSYTHIIFCVDPEDTNNCVNVLTNINNIQTTILQWKSLELLCYRFWCRYVASSWRFG